MICVESFHFSWLVYGNFLYFSSGKTCNENLMLSYMMLAILILGYFHMMLYLFIIVVVLVFLYKRYQEKAKKQMGSVVILRSLPKTKFSQALFKSDEECIICWNDYNESDDVTRLTCNENHFFHTACIESWIKAGNNSCPLCREPINKDIQL